MILNTKRENSDSYFSLVYLVGARGTVRPRVRPHRSLGGTGLIRQASFAHLSFLFRFFMSFGRLNEQSIQFYSLRDKLDWNSGQLINSELF